MFLLLGAFLAGIITAFAPCVLPLLPVIIGGSVSGNTQDKKRPLIIAISLAISLIVFTLLLKATSLFINISPTAITIVAGSIIIVVGILSLFPQLYEKLIIKLGIQSKSQNLMGAGLKKRGLLGSIITGAALGPVFSSCSPVYAYILATVLPVNFATAMIYIVAYVLGLSAMLLLIGYLGQRFVQKVKWASNPKGWFQRIIAILFIIVGLLVISGYDKQIQTYVSEKTPFDFDSISATLIPDSEREASAGVLNVKPYAAPEFVGLENWINSKPLSKNDLKGKVVLVDFWTYSCINCIRTQPYLKAWDDLYKDSGLVIVGVHAPEFAFEKNPQNVEKAVKAAGLTYPIALDNDFSTWNAYENRYWPAHYLLDAEGNVRRVHGGEGEYKETEDAIRLLLAEAGKNVPNERFVKGEASVPVAAQQTPETYLGTRRASNFVGTPRLTRGEHVFTPGAPSSNQWTLGGTWSVDGESLTARSEGVLRFKVSAKDVYLVSGQGGAGEVTVLLDGVPISETKYAGDDVQQSRVTIDAAKLYKLVHYDALSKGEIELRVPAGVVLNVFTFGS